VEPLEVGRRLELLPEGPFAQVVPLGQEPGPVVEALDPLTAKPVHQGLESCVGCEDRQGRVTRILGGSTDHLLGQGQELGRFTHLRSPSPPDRMLRPVSALFTAWGTSLQPREDIQRRPVPRTQP